MVDDSGKMLLVVLHNHGAKFVAADCLMKAVVAEDTKRVHPDSACPKTFGELPECL